MPTDDPADQAAAVTLLRRLAGRVPDAHLQAFRGYLAAWEWQLLTESLTGFLAAERIALTAAERRLLEQLAGPGAADGLPELAGDTEFAKDSSEHPFTADPDRGPPRYRFTADGPEPAAAERWLIDTVPSLPAARRLLGAYRRPASETALPLATWVYLVELDPGADVAHLQDQLRVGSPDRGVVEVYATGEQLPPYQAAALAAARLIWSHSPD